MRLLFLIPLLLAGTVSAEIYKSVDKDGNVVYQDTPGDAAEEFVPPSMNAIPMPKWQPAPEAPAEEQQESGYKLFFIKHPVNDQVVRSNAGVMNVSLMLKPALRQGHSIEIQLDGKKKISNSKTTSIQLSEVYPGVHNLVAIVRTADGGVVKRSNSVSFTMLRQHNPKKSSVGPRNIYGELIAPGPQTSHFKPGPIPATAPASQ